jgi:rubrerythrin
MKRKSYFFLIVLVAIFCFAVGALATKSPSLSEQTRQNLITAMKGEAFAQAKYMVYAQHARINGQTDLAELFEETASVERFEHFAEEAKLAGLAGEDYANLEDAINGESYEVETMYRDFANQAKAAGDDSAAALFEEIRKDEARHRNEFKAALERLVPALPSGQ